MSQERPHSFIKGHGGDEALPDKLGIGFFVPLYFRT